MCGAELQISTYLLADNFGQLVRIHRVYIVHIELEHNISTPVAGGVTVHGEAHRIQDIAHLLHCRLLENCPNWDGNSAGCCTQDRRGEKYEDNHSVSFT